MHSTNNTNTTHLPPLPTNGQAGLQVCAIMRLYLAVWDDLTAEQQYIVATHVQSCPDCHAEQQLLKRVTHLMQTSASSRPSSRVDQAVMNAIAIHSTQQTHPIIAFRTPSLRKPFSRRTPLRLTGLVAAAAVLMFALMASLHIVNIPGSTPQQAIVLPTSLSWAGYVLHHTETGTDNKGVQYRIDTYHNMQDNSMHIEVTQENALHVIIVSDTRATLGLDMMHRVAQWGATNWMGDESMFDLNELRRDLHTQAAIYLGKAQFRGEDVYRVRCNNGLVLLLDMHYMPVNVLHDMHTQTPVYDTLQWMPPASVSHSMWNMSIPSGFTMGTLPAKP